VTTFNRICLEDITIGGKLKLERGREYTTSAEKNGEVMVFSSYWAMVPVSLFAGAFPFTP
jgi:hypothetical protein